MRYNPLLTMMGFFTGLIRNEDGDKGVMITGLTAIDLQGINR